MLQILDLGLFASDVARGAPDTTTGKPFEIGRVEFAETVSCYSYAVSQDVALAVDGQYVFVAVGPKVHIVVAMIPSAPVEIATLDFGTNIIKSVQLRGDVALLAGTTGLVALDLSTLYDGDPTTVPSTATTHGTIALSNNARGAVWTRDRFVNTTGSFRVFGLTNVVDDDPATLWDSAHYVGASSTGFTSGNPTPLISGNHFYLAEQNRFAVYNAAPLWSSSISSFSSGLSGVALTETRGPFAHGGYVLMLPTGGFAGQSIKAVDVSVPTSPKWCPRCRTSNPAGSAPGPAGACTAARRPRRASTAAGRSR